MSRSRLPGLNRGPIVYKTIALPTELRRRRSYISTLLIPSELLFEMVDVVKKTRSSAWSFNHFLAFDKIYQMYQFLVDFVLKINKERPDVS